VSDSAPQPPAGHSRAFSGSTVRAVLVGLAGGAGLFLAWMAANTLFLIFVGLLFAALLDACTRGLGKILPLGRGWNLAIICFGFAVAIFGVLFWSGYSITSQIDQLVQALNQGLGFLEIKMVDLGFVPVTTSGRSASLGDLFRFLSTPCGSDRANQRNAASPVPPLRRHDDPLFIWFLPLPVKPGHDRRAGGPDCRKETTPFHCSRPNVY
jgi:hypothetical protein